MTDGETQTDLNTICTKCTEPIEQHLKVSKPDLNIGEIGIKNEFNIRAKGNGVQINDVGNGVQINDVDENEDGMDDDDIDEDEERYAAIMAAAEDSDDDDEGS